MATRKAQNKWRAKNRLVKKQLNVMARTQVHGLLDDLAQAFRLRGKGEAVTFACLLTEALRQRASYDQAAARLLEDVARSYARDRDMYAP